MTLRGRAARIAPLLTFLALAIAFLPFTTDDAYISLRYARNVANGAGAVFDAQPHGPEAYSSPLWMLASAAAFACGATDAGAVAYIKGLGMLFGLGVLLVLSAYSRIRARDEAAGTRAAWLAALMPWLSFWSVSGLETPLYVFLIVAALLAIESEDRRRRPGWGSGTLLALLAFARPEGILVAIGMIAGSFASGRRAWLRAAIAGAAFAAYSAWHISYFGSLLPATFLSKAGGFSAGHLWRRAIELAPLALYLSPLAVVSRVGRAEGPRLPGAAAGAMCACVIFAFVPRAEDGPGFRYELALLPFAASAAAIAWSHSRTRGRPWTRTAAPVLLGVFLISPIARLWPPARYAPAPQEIAFGRWLRVHAPAASVGVYNLGAIPYYSRLSRVIDIDAAGPLSPFPRGAYDPQRILSLAPSFLTLPPADTPARDPLSGIVRAASLQDEYDPLFDLSPGEGYRIVIWKRRDLALRADALHDAETFGLTRWFDGRGHVP